MSDSDLKSHLKRRSTWVRGLYMLLFALFYSLAEIVLVAVAVFQFGATLLTGRRNQRLLDFGAQLGRYMYQILQYVTFNSDDRPYPFDSWPNAGTLGQGSGGTGGDAGAGALPAGR